MSMDQKTEALFEGPIYIYFDSLKGEGYQVVETER
jgi:hypothetical protein